MTFVSASFELFRKQQQKEFLDKQKINPERRKDDFDISELLEGSKDEKGPLNRSKEPDELAMSLASENDSGKSSLPLQTPAVRPLVPPGFTSTILERNFGTKPSIHSDSSQVCLQYHLFCMLWMSILVSSLQLNSVVESVVILGYFVPCNLVLRLL